MRTGTVSYKLEDLKKGVIIPIGFVGENDFTRVIFDAEEIYKKYPSASVSMKVLPPKGGIYPATVIKEGNNVIWQVKAADLAYKGNGEIQLKFTAGEMVEKSYIARTDIKRSLEGNGPAPDPVQDWIDEATQIVEATEEAAEKAEASAEHAPMIGLDGYWYRWDAETEEYVNTGTKAQGEKGDPGDPGSPGDPTQLIDDTAGEGQTGKTWSADKLDETTSQLLTAIQGMKPTAENTDVGKYLKLKAIDQSGNPTEYEYGSDIDTIVNGGTIETPITKTVDFSDSENGYINQSGELVGGTSSTYVHTKPFTLKKGDKIDLSVRGYLQGTVILSVLAKVLTNGYQSLINSSSSTGVIDYTYTATADMQCVISYRAASNHSATIKTVEEINIAQQIVKKNHFVKVDGNTVIIKSHYNDDEDLVVEITKGGGNNLPNPKRIYTVTKDSDILNQNVTPSRFLLNRYTDWFSPHQVRAVNNADGSDTSTVIFTGGNHQSNNSSSGGVSTAENTVFKTLCDGVELADGDEVFCDSIIINITNEICGYNTWKSDGTGRKILREQIRVTADSSARMNVEIIHTAKEDIQRLRYYGLQCVLDSFNTGIQYLGGSNRSVNEIDENSNSGDKNCRDGRAISSNGDIMLTHIDTVDLGSFNYSPSTQHSYFATASATKAYYSLINNDGTQQNIFNQDSGEITVCRGWYDWIYSPSDDIA